MTEETILLLEQGRREAMLNADIDALQRLLAEDLVYVHSTGHVDSKLSYIGHIQRGDLRYRQLAMEGLTVRIVGPVALVHGQMRAQIEVQGQAHSMRSLFFTVWSAQDDGVWQLRSHQGTPRPD